MGPVGLHGRGASRRVGVMDRTRISVERESLDNGEEASVWVSLSVEAVPDRGKLSRTCVGVTGGAKSDRGAGTAISGAFAARTQFGGRAPL